MVSKMLPLLPSLPRKRGRVREGVAGSAPRAAIAARSVRRWPTEVTPMLIRSSAVSSGSTSPSTSLPRNAGAHCSSPSPRSQSATSRGICGPFVARTSGSAHSPHHRSSGRPRHRRSQLLFIDPEDVEARFRRGIPPTREEMCGADAPRLDPTAMVRAPARAATPSRPCGGPRLRGAAALMDDDRPLPFELPAAAAPGCKSPLLKDGHYRPGKSGMSRFYPWPSFIAFELAPLSAVLTVADAIRRIAAERAAVGIRAGAGGRDRVGCPLALRS
jgi:hypothetical protein